eukprot:TRINITY_DN8139_c0_g1_i7.p1 TRINITY_DN8139_c0_g1~~TRINITY_DN8139_c0_g1_i7.p1  ORF type:complete len:745 (+),score=151.60 TRINITY_DN8139_c0_g1_i7:158-2392(+)
MADETPLASPDDTGPESSFENDTTLRMVGKRDGIRVVVRVRPMASFENKPPRDYQAVDVLDDSQTLAVKAADAEAARSFTFHKVLGQVCGQQQFFEQCGIQNLIDSALQGYACTAFAFGQTGSGKTHTITGPASGDDDGVLQRSIGYLWAQVENSSEVSYSFQASYLEIYNEQVVDLLNVRHDRGAMPVRWKADKGFHVENLYHMHCDSYAAMIEVLEEGLKNRTTASHQMNDRSSRSHTILTIEITSMTPEADSSEEQPSVVQRHGAISFVDLAGSERTDRTKTDGHMLQESNNINKSLLTLGNCISCLADPRKRKGHIPFRDSVLTMLLKDSLGGSGMTLMIACVSPAFSSLAETQNTLRYASRAKRIQNKPIVRMEPQQQMIQALKREVRMLRKECAYLHNQIDSGSELGVTLTAEALRAHTLLAGVGRDASSMAQPSGSEMQEADVVATMARELTQAKVLLQQYMQENEDLRIENVALSSQYQAIQLDQERLERQNGSLMRQLKQARIDFERSRKPTNYSGRTPKKAGPKHSQCSRQDDSYYSMDGSSQINGSQHHGSQVSSVPGPTQHVTEMAQMAATQRGLFPKAANAVIAMNRWSQPTSPEPLRQTSPEPMQQHAAHSRKQKVSPKAQIGPKSKIKPRAQPRVVKPKRHGHQRTQPKPPTSVPPLASHPPKSPRLRSGRNSPHSSIVLSPKGVDKQSVQQEVDSLEAEIAAAEAALRQSASADVNGSTSKTKRKIKW